MADIENSIIALLEWQHLLFLYLLSTTSVNMKSNLASLLLGASVVTAASISPRDTKPVAAPKLGPDTVPGFKVVPPPLYSGLFDSNGKLQAVLSNGNYPAPKSLVPEVQSEKPIVFKDAKRVKIRYGPFRFPGTKEQNWQAKAMGLSGGFSLLG